MTACAHASPEAREEPFGRNVVRTLRVQRSTDPVSIAWEPVATPDRRIGEAISRSGTPAYAFDFPYPCGPCEGHCQRVIYRDGVDMAAVDALAARLHALGALLADEPYIPPIPCYPGEIPGQEALF